MGFVLFKAMNALSHEFDLAHAMMLPPESCSPHELPELGRLCEQWEAVHEAAAAVANLAQLGREAESEQIAKLPLRAAELSGWRFETIARGIDDLAAIMQPGLRALLSLTARGQDTTAAALTLWREFHASRSAIVDLAYDR